MNCNECILGAPYVNCWALCCRNYNSKKKKEKQWGVFIKKTLEEMEKKDDNSRVQYRPSKKLL